MAACNLLRFDFSPETLELSIKGEDLDLISAIYSELCFQNLNRSYRPSNAYLKPFLPKLPNGKNAMSRTKDLSGIGTLTINCTSLDNFFEVLFVVSEAYTVACAPGQKYSGTIEGVSDRGKMASALVSSFTWPISDGSLQTTSSVDAIDFSKLKV